MTTCVYADQPQRIVCRWFQAQGSSSPLSNFLLHLRVISATKSMILPGHPRLSRPLLPDFSTAHVWSRVTSIHFVRPTPVSPRRSSQRMQHCINLHVLDSSISSRVHSLNLSPVRSCQMFFFLLALREDQWKEDRQSRSLEERPEFAESQGRTHTHTHTNQYRKGYLPSSALAFFILIQINRSCP
jgi:hypothetical protein